jgi:hypothetical protein
MNRLISTMVFGCVSLGFSAAACFGQSAPANTADKCNSPNIFEVLPSATGVSWELGGKKYTSHTQWRLDGKTYATEYPLTALAHDLTECTPQRPLEVVLDNEATVGDLVGSVPSKLQAESVRYFVRIVDGFVEVKIGSVVANAPGTESGSVVKQQ